MNRKNLIELVAATAAMAALWGSASAAPPQHNPDVAPEANAELGSARNGWTECVQAAIQRLDDHQSSTNSVAQAAMKACENQYGAVEQALTHSLVATCGQDSDCMHRALAKAQREATKTVTDDVVNARVRAAGAQVLKCL